MSVKFNAENGALERQKFSDITEEYDAFMFMAFEKFGKSHDAQ